jgi:predicted PurR-regulated permease PerM
MENPTFNPPAEPVKKKFPVWLIILLVLLVVCCLTVICVVFVVPSLMGPAIGNIFSNVINSLTTPTP